jgi:hypothetical protein
MLHRSQWVVAGVWAAAQIALTAIRIAGWSVLPFAARFFLDYTWVLWLWLPVLLGCATVAEDRALGTLEGQLCLPVRRRTQFALKITVALGFAALFGAVAPLVLAGEPMLQSLLPGGVARAGAIGPHVPFIALLALSACMSLLSIYASSLSRGGFRALGPAALGFILIGIFCSFGMFPELVVGRRLWYGPIVFIVGLPLMAILLGLLAYWNYQHAGIDARVVRNNALGIVLSGGFVVMTTTAVYHRAWEWNRSEAPHGPARITGRSLVSTDLWGGVLGSVDGGRIWIATGGHVVDGTNWASAAIQGPCIAAAQNDGSLWLSRDVDWWEPLAPNVAPQTKMEKYREEGGWTTIVPCAQTGLGFLLLKKDGTIWCLNRAVDNIIPARFQRGILPGRSVVSGRFKIGPARLERLGHDSDWVAIYKTQFGNLCRKADGSVWRPTPSMYSSDKYRRDRFSVGGRTYVLLPVVPVAPRIKNWVEIREDGFHQGLIGLRDDGAILEWRLLGVWSGTPDKDIADLKPRMIGTGTNWVAIAANERDIASIKDDGSLWRWTFDRGYKNASPHRVGGKTDWISVWAAPEGIFSLAADGGVWLWQFPVDKATEASDSLWPRRATLLAPRKWPAYVGNIMAGH